MGYIVNCQMKVALIYGQTSITLTSNLQLLVLFSCNTTIIPTVVKIPLWQFMMIFE